MKKMKNLDVPFFSNTCGKLFSDTIIFASINCESKVHLQDIKKISFKRSVVLRSLWFIVVPLSIFGLSQLVSYDDTFVKMFMYSIASVFTLICLLKVEKKYTISTVMMDGSVKTIRVSNDNIKDAENFTNKAAKCIKEYRANAKTTAIAAKIEEAEFSKSVTNIIHH